jgi:autotransporter-associated beta strand protein
LTDNENLLRQIAYKGMRRISRIRGIYTTITSLGVALGLLLVGAAPAAAQNACRWTGAGRTTVWSDHRNWDPVSCGNGVPRSGDTLVFMTDPNDPPGDSTSNNDLDDGLLIHRILILGLGPHGVRWMIDGNSITIDGNIVVGSPNDDGEFGFGPSLTTPITLNRPITIHNDFAGGQGFPATFSVGDIDLNGFDLSISDTTPVDLSGIISGNGNLTIGGNTQVAQPMLSFVQLNDGGTAGSPSTQNDYVGTTEIDNGVVVVVGPNPFGVAENPVTFGTGVLMRIEHGLGTFETIGNTFALDDADGIEGTGTLSGDLLIGTNKRLVFRIGVDQPPPGGTLTLTGRIGTDLGPQLTKIGSGTLVLANSTPNKSTWTSLEIADGTVRTDVAGSIPSASSLLLAGTLDLHGFDATFNGGFGASVGSAIALGAATLTVNLPRDNIFGGVMSGTGSFVKGGPAALRLFGGNTYTGPTTLNAGTLTLANVGGNAIASTSVIVNGGTLVDGSADQRGNQIPDNAAVVINAPGQFVGTMGMQETIGSIAGNGAITLDHSALTVGANNTSTTFGGAITGAGSSVQKIGTGTLTLTGASAIDAAAISNGTLLVNGSLITAGAAGTVTLTSGVLGGAGSIGAIHAAGGAISPGNNPVSPGNIVGNPGILKVAGGALLDSTTFIVDLDGLDAGTGYDQLLLGGDLRLFPTTTLHATLRFQPPQGATFTIISLPAGKTVSGTFNGLPEGQTIAIGTRHFSISYRGGDGNDVVLTATDAPPTTTPPPPPPSTLTYYLSEGATGNFFDTDVLIANPNQTDAPITLTFSKENGEQVVTKNTVPAQSRLTVHVDQIPGLEATSASTQVQSDAKLPLLVERSMFWDASYYAGSTGTAVDAPATDWFFAEGSQSGYFNTFVLVINPNPTPTDVTFTFLREHAAPVTKTVTVGAATRFTLNAGDLLELLNTSFGIAVHGTQPIMAERSMYFGSTPTRVWSGGTESSGVTAPSTHWFFAEGATGSFFDTFILLSNPNNTPANVTLQYLLDSGDTISVAKTIDANARVTTSIEAEEDVRLHSAAVSTVVTSDVPVIAERSMYWPGAVTPWGEGHNSFGVVDAATKWGLSEGRTGGPLKYHTYMLLANPQTTAASVNVTFLRENGAAPVMKTFTVPATSRFNIDIDSVIELHDEFFGAVIESTNNVPIIVERSMYWDSNGIQFSGGTNATGIRLP